MELPSADHTIAGGERLQNSLFPVDPLPENLRVLRFQFQALLHSLDAAVATLVRPLLASVRASFAKESRMSGLRLPGETPSADARDVR